LTQGPECEKLRALFHFTTEEKHMALSNRSKVVAQMLKYGVPAEVAKVYAKVGAAAMDVGVPLESATELARTASYVARGLRHALRDQVFDTFRRDAATVDERLKR
jgi:hypothetical protein